MESTEILDRIFFKYGVTHSLGRALAEQTCFEVCTFHCIPIIRVISILLDALLKHRQDGCLSYILNGC